MYKKIISPLFLLSSTIFTTYANPTVTIEEIEKKFSTHPQYRSFPSPLNFQVTASRTGAGILHYADGPDGPYILLGHRNDDDSWCNLGGMSDANEGRKTFLQTSKSQMTGFLAETAAREVEEESNGYFAHHPTLVKNLPFIDTLNTRAHSTFLYRMYFKKVPMLNAENLTQAQEGTLHIHSREYHAFKWIPVQRIYDALFDNKNIVVGSEELKLFTPLIQTLKTPAGKNFLESIIQTTKIPRFSKNIRPFLNRIYDVRSKSQQDFKEPSTFHNSLYGPHNVPIASETHEAQLTYAVTAHGAAMRELKSKFDLKPTKDVENTPVPEEWNKDPKLSLSQIHLRMVLGSNYKTAEDFPGQNNPQRLANLANIREHLNYGSEDSASVKRPIENYTSEDISTLADILEWEDHHRSNPTFYHASTADVYNLWQSYTFLREMLSLTPLVGNKIIMRGTDIYFRGLRTMSDILGQHGYGDYQGRQLLVLSANYVLMADLLTTISSSSSYDYFINNHSATTPDFNYRFEEATALAGIIARYDYFRSLFLQYAASQDSKMPNSIMVGISAPVHLLPMHAYAAYGGGKDAGKPIMEVLKDIQDLAGAPLEMIKEDDREKIPEARLNLHPDFMLHSDVEVKTFNRFPLASDQQKKFDLEMRATTVAILAEWLKSRHQVMPDSFQDYPTLKRLYGYVWKNVTGEDHQEIFAYASFMHLLVSGCVEGARDFITKFPEIRQHKDFKPASITLNLIASGNVDTLKFFLEEIMKSSNKPLFEKDEDLDNAVILCAQLSRLVTLDCLLSNTDLSSISPERVRNWCSGTTNNMLQLVLGTDIQLTGTNYVLSKYFPSVKTEIEDTFIKHGAMLSSSSVLDYLKISGASPKEFFQKLLNNPSTPNQVFSDILENCDVDGATLFPDNTSLVSFLKRIGLSKTLDSLVNRGLSADNVANAALDILKDIPFDDTMKNRIRYFYFFKFVDQHSVKLTKLREQEAHKIIESYIVLKITEHSWTPEQFAAVGITEPQTLVDTVIKNKDKFETGFGLPYVLQKIAQKYNFDFLEDYLTRMIHRSQGDTQALIGLGFKPREISEAAARVKGKLETFIADFNKAHRLDPQK